jgi:hypothetical protein
VNGLNAEDALQKNEVIVSHAYGCKMKTPYRFTSANIAEITSLLRKVKRNNSPASNRLCDRIDGAIGWGSHRHQGQGQHPVDGSGDPRGLRG